MENQYTKFEIARIIGSRALQISMGAPFLIKLDDAELERISYNPMEIAKLEFKKGVLPIGVKRPLPKELISQVQNINIAIPNIDE